MEKYEAAMVLGAVGDAMGFRHWDWESCQSGCEIMRQLKDLGGLKSLSLTPDLWPVSDDTIMHISTARALLKECEDKSELYQELCRCYVKRIQEAKSRRPDPAFVEGCSHLRPRNVLSWHIPFDSKATGSGAATKAMCIGLRYPKEDQINDLLQVATECGRMTHNHPLGFMGSVCTALFTSFAVRNVRLPEWGRKMLEQTPKVTSYCTKTIRHSEQYSHFWFYFETKWEMYLKERGILKEDEEYSPTTNDIEERDRLWSHNAFSNFHGKIYRTWSSEGYPGRRGHDAPMIAYDALLATSSLINDSERWKELCNRGMLHGGKTDSTGAIAGFLHGLIYGYSGVPTSHYAEIEFHEELKQLGRLLYEKAHDV